MNESIVSFSVCVCLRTIANQMSRRWQIPEDPLKCRRPSGRREAGFAIAQSLAEELYLGRGKTRQDGLVGKGVTQGDINTIHHYSYQKRQPGATGPNDNAR